MRAMSLRTLIAVALAGVCAGAASVRPTSMTFAEAGADAASTAAQVATASMNVR